MMASDQDLQRRRRELMVKCGLDAFSHPAGVWLNMAAAAEKRGDRVTQANYEAAMDIAAELWGPN